MKDYDYMQNREVSWLRFNERVLEEAAMENVPLLEKLKFISIFTSNLDEFFMIRVGSLHALETLKKKVIDNKSGLTPKGQIEKIMEMLPPMMEKKDRLYKEVTKALEEHGILRMNFDCLTEEQENYIEEFYYNKIDELVSPQIIDWNHPFPFLENNKRFIFLELERDNGKTFGLVPIRKSYPDYIILPGGRFMYMSMEDILLHYVDEAFPGFKILSKHVISVTRNFDLSESIESKDEFDDFKEYMKAALKKRTRQDPVRLQSRGKLPHHILKFLLEKLDMHKSHYFPLESPINMSYVFGLIDDIPTSIAEELLYKDFNAYHLENDGNESMIEKVREKDRLLLYPFDHVDAFLQLLKEASENPECTSIKITIYRLAKSSQVAKYLCRAAEAGKEVTVFMELKARFDEERNIQYSNRLYESGCNIIYGFSEYKTHSKICLLTFRDKNMNNHYITQLATGNYNESTAKQYTDFSFITADKAFGLDGVDFFKNMAIGNLNGKYGHILQAPTGLKQRFMTLLDREIEKGEDGYIFAKFNSLTDKDFINKFKEASEKGVKVRLVIRGICCILPGLKDYTENIEVHSIVGRFLEHTRLYVFGKGEDRLMYISSADLMTRNMERRVELASPIYDKELQEQLMRYCEIVFGDNIKGRRVNEKGEYETIPQGDKPLSSQDYFIEAAEKREAESIERREKEAETLSESVNKEGREVHNPASESKMKAESDSKSEVKTETEAKIQKQTEPDSLWQKIKSIFKNS